MTPEKREQAVKWLQEEIRSLRLAPKINGCGPENWAEQLEIMETCLEAVRDYHFPDTREMLPLTLEQLREMDGKPAWIVPVGAEDWESHWDVMRHKRFSADSKTERGKMYFLYESSYGSRWIAYSYPPAHIDREAWKPCESCMTCDSCKNREEYNPYEGTFGECGTCYKNSNYEPDNFCNKCGRPLTDEAWAELEKRLRG